MACCCLISCCGLLFRMPADFACSHLGLTSLNFLRKFTRPAIKHFLNSWYRRFNVRVRMKLFLEPGRHHTYQIAQVVGHGCFLPDVLSLCLYLVAISEC